MAIFLGGWFDVSVRSKERSRARKRSIFRDQSLIVLSHAIQSRPHRWAQTQLAVMVIVAFGWARCAFFLWKFEKLKNKRFHAFFRGVILFWIANSMFQSVTMFFFNKCIFASPWKAADVDFHFGLETWKQDTKHSSAFSNGDFFGWVIRCFGPKQGETQGSLLRFGAREARCFCGLVYIQVPPR